MKAIIIREFGGPDVLKQEEVDRPVPAPDELLVKVYASGVNPVDWVVRNGTNEAMRAFLPLPLIPGWDVAGVVEETGSEVTGFQKGDAVYGVPNFPGNGSYAEYCAAKATRFARKPQSLGFTEASGVPLAALTAWTGMFADGKLQAGQRILIQGASGGVGSFAVQLAKAKGAYVMATTSSANTGYVRQLGADEVIDYTTQKIEEMVTDADVVLEASPLRENGERIKAVSVLKAGGIFVSVNADFPFTEELEEVLAKKGVKGELSYNQPRQEWLQEIAQLIDEGKVKVLISHVFPWNEVADAHRESQSGRVRGKLVLEIRKDEE